MTLDVVVDSAQQLVEVAMMSRGEVVAVLVGAGYS